MDEGGQPIPTYFHGLPLPREQTYTPFGRSASTTPPQEDDRGSAKNESNLGFVEDEPRAFSDNHVRSPGLLNINNDHAVTEEIHDNGSFEERLTSLELSRKTATLRESADSSEKEASSHKKPRDELIASNTGISAINTELSMANTAQLESENKLKERVKNIEAENQTLINENAELKRTMSNIQQSIKTLLNDIDKLKGEEQYRTITSRKRARISYGDDNQPMLEDIDYSHQSADGHSLPSLSELGMNSDDPPSTGQYRALRSQSDNIQKPTRRGQPISNSNKTHVPSFTDQGIQSTGEPRSFGEMRLNTHSAGGQIAQSQTYLANPSASVRNAPNQTQSAKSDKTSEKAEVDAQFRGTRSAQSLIDAGDALAQRCKAVDYIDLTLSPPNNQRHRNVTAVGTPSAKSEKTAHRIAPDVESEDNRSETAQDEDEQDSAALWANYELTGLIVHDKDKEQQVEQSDIPTEVVAAVREVINDCCERGLDPEKVTKPQHCIREYAYKRHTKASNRHPDDGVRSACKTCTRGRLPCLSLVSMKPLKVRVCALPRECRGNSTPDESRFWLHPNGKGLGTKMWAHRPTV